MAEVSFSIDGLRGSAPEGTTVLQAARALGIPIPTLCEHPKLTPFGGCRLCLVEIKGVPRPLTACTTPVAEGMEVTTSSPKLQELRKTMLQLILSDHPNDCMVCEKAGDCTLQELAYAYGIRENPYQGERRTYQQRDGNPFIERDMEKCILCARCVKVCDEVQGVGAIEFAYRGFKAKVATPFERDLDCEFCGQCVAVCPTGALTGKMWAGLGRRMGVREVDTICPYCGTGCQITLHVKDNQVVRVSSRADSWNEGWLCVKGRFGYRFISSPDRLKKPLVRRGSRLLEASWQEALSHAAEQLLRIKQQHGPQALGGLSSARCTTEENYLFQKLMRAALGSNNVDHCARL
jgi:predicted molibdopterin-dependent oxidoreductase YjgC